jgi:L-asparaginase
MSVKLLLTGGTIDKYYNQFNGELNFVDSHLPELLKLGRNHADIDIQQLMLKDSLDMFDADREVIKQACEKSVQENILITHGTDTMVETAGYLAKSNLEKTIVLVGAMIPYVFKDTDAVFNVGFALAAVQTLPQGVFITMNGKVFDWDKVTKNRKIGVFESL